MLDLIVTHYKEPWETGEKFFNMLDLQRGVDFGEVKVILVNDGEENKLSDARFENRPYAVKQISIPHAGVSAARNAGIRASDAEWIMFCDFDDMFASVYALRDIMTVLPAPGFDMLWCEIYSEDKLKSGETILHKRLENVVFVHGKVYRRQFLIDNDLWFDTSLEFNEDSAFNAILQTVVDYRRTGKITTLAPIYIWCFNENSATTTPGNRWKALYGLYERNKRVCEAFKKRLPRDRYCAMVARTIVDAYYALNVEEFPPELKDMYADFKAFYREHKKEYVSVPLKTMLEVKAISKAEHERGNQEEKERWNTACIDCMTKTEIPIRKWLESLETEGDA